MTALTYFSKKTEEQIRLRYVQEGFADGDEEGDKKWKALSRSYQLEILAAFIKKYILGVYPELACLESDELKVFRSKFEAENLQSQEEWRKKERALVDAEDAYCRTIFNIGRANGLEQAYIFE